MLPGVSNTTNTTRIQYSNKNKIHLSISHCETMTDEFDNFHDKVSSFLLYFFIQETFIISQCLVAQLIILNAYF